LNVIAWERYVAVQKWMNYNLIITNGRLKKIAIATWLSALFPTVANYIMQVVFRDGAILSSIAAG